ncbi:MAG: type II toxin-antitoxin system VapC family toxin [Gemmatimonadales bacterium]
MPFVFDTNVAVAAARDREERARFVAFIRARCGRVWLHACVWLELGVGARTEEERAALESFVQPFVGTGRVLVPSRDAWQQAGRVLARLAGEHGVDVRRSSVHHDAIIAASVREREFTLVTRNLAEFELIAPYLSKLTFAAPYP